MPLHTFDSTNMNTLLISSTANEIKPFLNYYRKSNDFFQTDVFITGVGLMNTTYHLLKLIHLKKPGLVVQAGVAGSFEKTLPPATVVIVKKDTVADLGAEENNKLLSVFDLKLEKKNRWPFTNGWLVNKSDEFKKLKLKKVTAVTVNQVSTSKKMIDYCQKKYKPVIETLEGAALHYVCLNENIPFIQLRSVSNYIGERNKKNWKMKEAITNLNEELLTLFNLLKK